MDRFALVFHNKYITGEEYIYIDIDPDGKRGENDKRSIGKALLKHDLTKGKVAWHGDYFIDFYQFLRNEHAFFSLFYADQYHPYNRKERLWSMFGISILAIGAAVLSTWSVAAVLFGEDNN